MKVAIVHDWLVDPGGAENVLAAFFKLFPEAELFTVVDFFSPENRERFLQGRVAKTTFIQRMPLAAKRYRSYLPLMPVAIEQLDLRGFDLVLSSSYAVAKGVITGPQQAHVSYVHSPMRYAWDLQEQYLEESGMSTGLKGAVARLALHYMRLWDVRSASSPDRILANSDFVRRRIEKCYRRSAEVIYPPVDVDAFAFSDTHESFYLTASRMVPYKKVPLIVEAFSRMPDKKLIVVGDGPEMSRVKSVAGPNVDVLGYQSRESLLGLMQSAKAFVYAAEEDFGIVPVEAQACGTPVIAFGRGGVTESVIGLSAERPTGVFFPHQEVDSVIGAVNEFEREAHRISAVACRENALRFSPAVFEQRILAVVEAALDYARGGQLHTSPNEPYVAASGG
jgi:glycosyltransferase involved in cell wall biosynthesis